MIDPELDPFNGYDGLFGSTEGSQTGGSGAGLDPNNQPGLGNRGTDDPTSHTQPAPTPAPTPAPQDATSTIAGNTSALSDYYTKNFGRPMQAGEATDAKRAFELGIPIDQLIKNSVAPRLTNEAHQGDPAYAAKVKAIGSATDPQQKAVLKDQLARELQASLSAAGHDVKWSGDQLMVDGRPYAVNDGSWAPSGQSGYTPGEIPTSDVPSFSFDQLMSAGSDPETDAFISSLLSHPESMDPLTVARMKATSKDELAGMDQQNQDQIDQLGSNYGIAESPWIAAQHLDASRARDNSLIQSNRAIDATAATTNMADRRAAAGIGLERLTARQSKAQGAANTLISQAAATGDRLQLRESVKQQAAALGISAEKVLSDYNVAKMNDATQRYGIDVDSAMKKYGIDMNFESAMQAISHADKRAQEDLALALKTLEYTDSRAGESAGIEAARVKETERHNRVIEGQNAAPAPG